MQPDNYKIFKHLYLQAGAGHVYKLNHDLNIFGGVLNHQIVTLSFIQGHVIAQVVLWQPRFNPTSGHLEFVVDRVTLGQVFPGYFSFPCQFHQMLQTHLSSGAGTLGQFVSNVPSRLSLTPPHEIKKKLEHYMNIRS
jgi:hypothetical protein